MEYRQKEADPERGVRIVRIERITGDTSLQVRGACGSPLELRAVIPGSSPSWKGFMPAGHQRRINLSAFVGFGRKTDTHSGTRKAMDHKAFSNFSAVLGKLFKKD